MRTTIWLVSVALLGGAACKKSSTEKAATEVRKAQENVQEQKKDVREANKDMGDEARDVTKEGQNVAKQGSELTDAERRLADARVKLDADVKTRLAQIDLKIASLDSQTDPLSKQLATDLRSKRDIVAQRATAADSIAVTNWDAFKNDISENLDMLEKDANKALSTDKDRDKILEHKLKMDSSTNDTIRHDTTPAPVAPDRR